MKSFIFYLHSLLLAFMAPLAVYVMFLEAQVYSSPQDIWRTVIVCISIALIVAILYFLTTKDNPKSALFTSFTILAILYPPHLFWIFLSGIGICWIMLAIVSKKTDFKHGHAALFFVSACSVIYILVQYNNIQQSMPRNAEQNLLPPAQTTLQPTSYIKPDIYYIIPDGYGSQPMLQTIHNFDNTEFIQSLEERGFIVTPHSKSNYHRSLLSISSSLNMQYLDTLPKTLRDSYLWWPMTGTFTNNQVQQILARQGYKTVNITSGWDYTTFANSDYYLAPHSIMLNKFEKIFIQRTPLVSLNIFNWGNSISYPNYSTHRKIVLYAFEQLHEIPNLPGPKFVFVHIMSPHAPFVFDAQGNHLTPDYPFTFSDNGDFLPPADQYRKEYLEQLQFMNTQILAAIDVILEKSSTPPIIIIQGDHGPSVFVSYSSADSACLYERYSILNAYFLPGVSQDTIPDDISPVNTFRFIFNHYFATDFEYLPNRHYFSSASSMYEFEEIDVVINEPCLRTE